MIQRFCQTHIALLVSLIFTASCLAASSGSPPSPSRPHRADRQANTDRMPSTAETLHSRKELIQQIFFRQRRKAPKKLINSMALLTEGYGESQIQSMVHHLSQTDRCFGQYTDYAAAANLLWQKISVYDADNPIARNIKTVILESLSEGAMHPEAPALLKQLSGFYAQLRNLQHQNNPQQQPTRSQTDRSQATNTTQQTALYPLLRHVHQTDAVKQAGRDLVRILASESFDSALCRSILFCGPPGVGKTHMVRAIAHESKSALTKITATELRTLYQSSERNIQEFFETIDSNRPAGTKSTLLHLDKLGSLGLQDDGTPRILEKALTVLWNRLDAYENNDKKIVCIGECINHIRGNDHDPGLVQHIKFPQLSASLLKKVITDAAQLYQLELTEEQINKHAKKMFNWGPQEAVRFVKQLKRVSLDRKTIFGTSQPPLERVHLPDALKAILYSLVEQLQVGALDRQQQRALLFCGPPGTGKTMAIHAIRNESKCHIKKINAAALAQSYAAEENRALQSLLNDAISKRETKQCTIVHISGLKYLTFDDNNRTPKDIHEALSALCDMLQSPQYRDSGILCIGECNLYTQIRGSQGPRAQRVHFQNPTHELLQKIFEDQRQKINLEMNREQIRQCLDHMRQWRGAKVAQFIEDLPAQLLERGVPLSTVLDELFTQERGYPLLQHMHHPENIMGTIRKLVHQLKTGHLRPQTHRGLILYGPPGVGKSEMVQAMINETGSQAISGCAATLINQYQGSGANAIQDMFDEITANRRDGQGAIIFFDELESIQATGEDANQHHRDSQKAMATLWTMVNACKSDRRRNHILFIGACNDYSCFDARIRERCTPLKFDLPNENMLKKIIQDKAQRLEFPLSSDLAHALLQKLKGWSGRNATRVIEEAKDLSEESQAHFNRQAQQLRSTIRREMTEWSRGPWRINVPDRALRYHLKVDLSNTSSRAVDILAMSMWAKGWWRNNSPVICTEPLLDVQTLMQHFANESTENPTVSILPTLLMLSCAFEKEKKEVDKIWWDNFWKKTKKARLITLATSTGGATAPLAFVTITGPAGAAGIAICGLGLTLGNLLGNTIEGYFFDGTTD